MEFDVAKDIVNNRLKSEENLDKKAKQFAEKVVNQEKEEKPEKKDTLKDMQDLAKAKNLVAAMTAKAKQQSGETITKKPSTKKKTTDKKTSKKEAKKKDK